MAAYGHIDTWINNEQLVSDILVVYQKIGHIGTYMHMSSQWTTCIGGFSFYSNHSIWGHIGIYRHMSTQWTTSLRGCSCVSNHWPNGRNGHIPSQEFTVDNTYWRLWLCLQPVPTWGHMGTYIHMSSQCTSCIEGFSFDSNHWPYGGPWSHTDTWVYIERTVSEILVVYLIFGHMGENGHIHTHEWVHNGQQVLKAVAMTQYIGHMRAHGHILTHEFTLDNKYWRL